VPRISGRHSFPPPTALARRRAEEYAGSVTCEGGCSYRSPNPVFSRSGLFTSHCEVPIRSSLRCHPPYNSWDGISYRKRVGGKPIPRLRPLAPGIPPHSCAKVHCNRSNTPIRAIPLELCGTTGENTCPRRLETVPGGPPFTMHAIDSRTVQGSRVSEATHLASNQSHERRIWLRNRQSELVRCLQRSIFNLTCAKRG